jgi:hypothetical protein
MRHCSNFFLFSKQNNCANIGHWIFQAACLGWPALLKTLLPSTFPTFPGTLGLSLLVISTALFLQWMLACATRHPRALIIRSAKNLKKLAT